MTNPKTDYNDYVRANLPLGMVYNGTVDRYQTNDHSFVTYKEADWYYNYIINNFDPVSLDPKILIDPSDLSTLFQDTAGTTPVTSSGDPVGLALDKSGNDNHLTAPSDSARPTYQTDGTYSWLEFDGVDDQLEALTRFGLSANPSILCVCGVRPLSNTSITQRLWQLGAKGVAGTLSGTLGTDGLSWRFNNGNRIFENVPSGSDYVISHSRQAGDTYGDSKAFVNGAESAETSNTNPTFIPTNTAQIFNIGLGVDGGFWRLYSFTLLEEHTSEQQLQLELWSSRKTGITL